MKHRGVVTVALAAAGLAGLAAPVISGSAEDDLAIVKKAVASPSPGRAVKSRAGTSTAAARIPMPAESGASAVAQVTPAAPAAAPEARPLPRPGREPRWFKVRVFEKGTGRNKVTINLPLSLVRALGDDTIDWGCRGGGDRERCRTIRLSEVLRGLEAGQELVEIEDEEAMVKVWVE